MTKINKFFLSALFLFFVSLTSIFPSCSTANLSDVKLCTSMSGGLCDKDMSTFPGNTDVIYVTANLNNAPSDTKVTFSWKKGDTDMGTANVSTGSGTVNSSFKPSGMLEAGKYSVTLKIDADN